MMSHLNFYEITQVKMFLMITFLENRIVMMSHNDESLIYLCVGVSFR